MKDFTIRKIKSSARIIGAASVATGLRVKDPLNYANNFFTAARGAIILIFNLFLFVDCGIRKHFSKAVHAKDIHIDNCAFYNVTS